MKKIILAIILGIFLISLVGATQQTLGTFKQGSCMQLVQTCGNCTYNNISFVYQTNNAILYNISDKMTKVGTFYNHTFCNTSLVGEYVVNGVGNPNGEITSWVYDFAVTPTGTILETSDSNLYILLTLASLFFFLLCLWGGVVLPFRNNRNDEGGVISVQKLKYFKVGLLFLSYVFLIWLLNLLLALSTNFSILTQYTKFFEVVFSVMNAMSYPIFVFMLIIMSIMGWKDLQLKKLLQRGLNPD